MRLFSHICIKTVKWRVVLFWFAVIMTLMTLGHWNWVQIAVTWVCGIALLFMIVCGVWARSIHGIPEVYAGFSWIWAHSFKEPELAPHYISRRAMEMRMWCRDNAEGGWTQCRNGGYFAFRKKSDAMAFKLTWLGG